MSSPEMRILNNDKARVASVWNYWLASPTGFYNSHAGNSVVGTYYQDSDGGVRPAISLVPGTEYSSGDGSMANPYVVKMN